MSETLTLVLAWVAGAVLGAICIVPVEQMFAK